MQIYYNKSNKKSLQTLSLETSKNRGDLLSQLVGQYHQRG